MIRVTEKNGSCWEYVAISKVKEDCIDIVNTYEQIIICHFENIVKIEKQVKDLTKQEIYEYTMYKYDGIRKVMIWADCVEIDLGYEYIELNNDDYIDVTELYKEVKE